MWCGVPWIVVDDDANIYVHEMLSEESDRVEEEASGIEAVGGLEQNSKRDGIANEQVGMTGGSVYGCGVVFRVG